MTLDVKNIQKDFPILARKVNNKRLVYLDNASTTQKPSAVLKAMGHFYTHFNSNVHRGANTLSDEATNAYEAAHKAVAKFINAQSWREVVFTKNTTEAMNLLAYSFSSLLKEGDEIILSAMEHHSSLVPWQQMAKKVGAIVKYIPLTEKGMLDMGAYASLLSEKTKVVCVVHVSNSLGTVNDVQMITQQAYEYNKDIFCIVDAAQSVPHRKVDVQALGADALVFSGHKMLGPTGIGVLVTKEDWLNKLPPFLFGGAMISEVTYEESSWNELPWKFEAGTPPIAEAIGLHAAIDYLTKIGMVNIEEHEKALLQYAHEQLNKIEGVKIMGAGPEQSAGVLSFVVEGMHPHDLSTLLDRYGVIVRGGHHCTMPLMKSLDVTGTTRASFYLYNTKEDVDVLVEAVKEAKKVFA